MIPLITMLGRVAVPPQPGDLVAAYVRHQQNHGLFRAMIQALQQRLRTVRELSA